MTPKCGQPNCYAQPAIINGRKLYYCVICEREIEDNVNLLAPRKPIPRGPSELEGMFDTQYSLLCKDLPEPEHEFKPFPDRKHRLDRSWPALKLCVEVEGFGHGWGKLQYASDLTKYNRLAADGWCLLRCNRAMLFDDPLPFFELLRQCIQERML